MIIRQTETKHSLNIAVFLYCLFFCSILFPSCISIPGEKAMEDKNLAAEYYDIALKYVDLKQYDKALQAFQKARDKSSDTIQIDYQIARTYALSNKWPEACEAFEKLLELDTENTTLKESYAYSLYKSGEKEKALQLYAELCELNKGNERLSKNYKQLYKEAYPPEPETADSDDSPLSDQEAIGS